MNNLRCTLIANNLAGMFGSIDSAKDALAKTQVVLSYLIQNDFISEPTYTELSEVVIRTFKVFPEDY